MGLRARLTLLLAGRAISRPFLWAKTEPGPYDGDRYRRQSGVSGRPGAVAPNRLAMVPVSLKLSNRPEITYVHSPIPSR